MRRIIIVEACIAATIEVESPDHAPRMGGLVTESLRRPKYFYYIFCKAKLKNNLKLFFTINFFTIKQTR